MYSQCDQTDVRTVAQIDLSAFRHNLQQIRNQLAPTTQLMGVIKADGYGHGAVPLAQVAGDLYDCYATATIEEALELRNAGLTKPILILGHIFPSAYAQAIAHDIALTISSLAMAQDLQAQAMAQNRTVQVHLAINTGLNRLGFAPTAQSIADILQISQLSQVHIEGIFTHYACADEVSPTMAQQQLACFDDFVAQVQAQGIDVPLLHTANSAGITQVQGAHHSLVRAGIVQYGLQPSSEVSALCLRPILSWKAQVAFVKQVAVGDCISYGATWQATAPRTIATIAVGYADGYPRALSNQGQVLIHGQFAPIVGRICMDQFMVDVTDLPPVTQGDTATLVGTDGQNCITVEQVAGMAHSFNYEFVCNINKRVPRQYV